MHIKWIKSCSKTQKPLGSRLKVTLFVKVRDPVVSVLGRNVGVPQQPLENEHGQTQGVTVALKRDELPKNRLGISKKKDTDMDHLRRQMMKKQTQIRQYLQTNP